MHIMVHVLAFGLRCIAATAIKSDTPKRAYVYICFIGHGRKAEVDQCSLKLQEVS